MVILYDIENLQTKENISYVVKKFANNKKVSAQFAYANWSIFGKGVAEFLSAHDVKLRQVDSWDGLSGYLKNACDIALTTDAVEMLYENPNINEKQMDAFALGMIGEITLEIEQSSYIVVDFLLDELSKFTGVKRKKLRPVAQNYEKKAA